MTKKYVDGLPLARQEKIWARQGVELSRATLANWVIQCTQTWLKPLYRHMKQALLEDTVIHADETTVQVLKENGKTSYILPKARNEHRQNVVRPLLEEYFCWLKTVHPEKGSKLEDAVRYSLNQKQQLMAFLDSTEVPISNNLAENAIRPFVVGRKNWLFCDSVKGAESSAIVYSIAETAKANNLEPYDYLLRVLSLLPGKGKSPSHEELERLMPWHPDVQGREVLRKRKT